MKLEPVAWMYQERKGKPFASTVPPESQDPIQLSENEVTVTALYAIPEGYVVVPVSLLKRANAAMMEWAAKYGEHNPQWLPPARVSELHAEIESMIAAKEQQ